MEDTTNYTGIKESLDVTVAKAEAYLKRFSGTRWQPTLHDMIKDQLTSLAIIHALLDAVKELQAQPMCNKCAWQGCQWGVNLEAQLAAKGKEIEELNGQILDLRNEVTRLRSSTTSPL